MITLMSEKESIFLSSADMLVCPVNTRGVMGAGLAPIFERTYPDASASYKRACADNHNSPLEPGGVHYARARRGGRNIWIAFAATKDDWREPSKLVWVRDICNEIANDIEMKAMAYSRVDRVAVPALGAGLGGLSWDAVYNEMHEAFAHSNTIYEIYPPRSRR